VGGGYQINPAIPSEVLIFKHRFFFCPGSP
jgi:hypothetical protein